MSVASRPVGRRERNKQEKLDRITAAASELFAEHGVDEVTTQQIADKADIGTGTLFLYAKTKGELLLLVQNANYAEALERGRADAESIPTCWTRCWRSSGRSWSATASRSTTGAPTCERWSSATPRSPVTREALAIVAQTEEAIAAVLRRDERVGAGDAATLAHIVSAVMFLSMAASVNIALSVEEIVQDIRRQIERPAASLTPGCRASLTPVVWPWWVGVRWWI